MRWLFLNSTARPLFPDGNLAVILLFEILTVSVESAVLIWLFKRKKVENTFSIFIAIILANLVSFFLGLLMWLLIYRSW